MNKKPYDPKDEEALLMPHEADGIKELDNLLPRWWVWLFYLCVAFSVVYLLYYHVFNAGDLQIAEYQKEAKAGEQIKAAALARFEGSLDTLTPLTEEARIGAGLQVYTTYCAPCHRPDAGGLVGPNLTDDYWIHGSNYVESVKVIINGVPEKGMLAWKAVLNPNDIQNVASYIYTLRGTKPENPKPPENQQSAAPDGPSEYE